MKSLQVRYPNLFEITNPQFINLVKKFFVKIGLMYLYLDGLIL